MTMPPPESPHRLPVEWTAVVVVICTVAVAVSVAAFSIAAAVDGGPVPPALSTVLGVLIGLAAAYAGPGRPDR